MDVHAKVVIDRTHNSVQVDSEKPREALAQAITEEGYRVAD
jgi:copper chaperone